MNKNSVWCVGNLIHPCEVTGTYDMVTGVTPANSDGPPPHFHEGYHEVFLITEGEMDFMIDGKPRKVGPGETVDLPKGTLHTFRNSGSTDCKWVNLHSPKGFRSFFETLSVPAEESNAKERSVERALIARIMQEAKDYDMHIRLPELRS